MPPSALTARGLRFARRAVVALCLPLAVAGAQRGAAPRLLVGPVDVVPIAEARARGPGGDTVVVAGRATVASGVLQHQFEIALQDGTGGLRVFSRSVRHPVQRGDSVEVAGVMQLYRGDLELMAVALRVVPGEPRHVEPVPIRVSAESAAAHAGELVRATGRVRDLGRGGRGQWMHLESLNDGGAGLLTVWVGGNSRQPADLHAFDTGDIVEVTGLVTAYRDKPSGSLVWQIVPRTPEDVRPQGIPRSWYRRGILAVLAVVLFGVAAVAAARARARRHARSAAETEARFRQLLAILPDAVLVYVDDRILFTNPAAARLLEMDDERALEGRGIDEFLGPDSHALARPAPNDTPIDALGVARLRGRLIGVRGTAVDVEVATSPCRYDDRPAMVMLARDITEQLRHERDLHALALRDELTGLHNRRGFTLFAEQELARARRYGRSAFLLFADLNGLKRINDEHGHAAGDEALCVMARALRTVVRESDVVARWGGDEFVALMFQTEALGAEAIGERLNETLRRLADESLPFTASASVGGTDLDPSKISDIGAAIDRADSDLYRRRQLVRARSENAI